MFLTDEGGNWYHINTHGSPEWNNVADELRNTQGGAYLTGLLMLQAGDEPTKIIDVYEIGSCIRNFGDG